jgi:hypothetical protein
VADKFSEAVDTTKHRCIRHLDQSSTHTLLIIVSHPPSPSHTSACTTIVPSNSSPTSLSAHTSSQQHYICSLTSISFVPPPNLRTAPNPQASISTLRGISVMTPSMYTHKDNVNRPPTPSTGSSKPLGASSFRAVPHP